MNHPAATALPWSSVTAAARHRAGNDATSGRAEAPGGAAAFAAELTAAGLAGRAVASADAAASPAGATAAAVQPAPALEGDDVAALAVALDPSLVQTPGSAPHGPGWSAATSAGDTRSALASQAAKAEPVDQKPLHRPGQWPKGMRHLDGGSATSPAAMGRDGVAGLEFTADVAEARPAAGASADLADTTTEAQAADRIATATALAGGASTDLTSWWAQSAAWARNEAALAHHAVDAAAAADASKISGTPAGATGHDEAVALWDPLSAPTAATPLTTLTTLHGGAGRPASSLAADGYLEPGRRALPLQQGAEGSASAPSQPSDATDPLSKVAPTVASAMPSALASGPVSARPGALTEDVPGRGAPHSDRLAGAGDATAKAANAPVRGTVVPSDASRKNEPAMLAPPEAGPVTAPPPQADDVAATPTTGAAGPHGAPSPVRPIRPMTLERAAGVGRQEPTMAVETAANPAPLSAGAASGAPAFPAAGTFVLAMPLAAEAVNAPSPGVEGRLPVPPGDPRFAPALAQQVTVFVRQGVHEARLQLHPAELGPITVQIQLDGSAAQVSMAAAHAQTRQALEQALPTLAATLREAGLTLTGGGVFEQPHPGQGDTPGNRAGGDGSRDRGGEARGGSGDDRAGTEGTARALRPVSVRGLIDLVA